LVNTTDRKKLILNSRETFSSSLKIGVEYDRFFVAGYPDIKKSFPSELIIIAAEIVER
jgi:hypothetical protein